MPAGAQAIDVGSYDFIVRLTLKDSLSAANYASVGDLRASIDITPAVAADQNGAPFSAGVNLFFGGNVYNPDKNIFEGSSIVYCGSYHYLVLSESAFADTGITHDKSKVVNLLTVHPSTNKDVSAEASVTYTAQGSSFDGALNAGIYEITATVSHRNFQPFNLTCRFTIEKADIAYYFVGNDDLVYDMNSHYISVSKTDAYADVGGVTQIDLNGSDKASVAYTYSYNGEDKGVFSDALNVGTYLITATITILGDAGKNYNIWGDRNTRAASITIAPFATSVKWSNTLSTVFNGNELSSSFVTAEFTDPKGNRQEMAVTYLGTDGKAKDDTVLKNAGTYTVTATHARMSNYTFANGTTTTFVIRKADVVRYLKSTSVPYGAKTYYLSLNTADAANITDRLIENITVMGETIKVVYTYEKANGGKDVYMQDGTPVTLQYGARNAGTYTVTANIDLGAGESNFNAWQAAKTAELTVSRLVLTASSATNYTKTYDGNNEVADCVIEGVLYNSAYITFKAYYNDKNAGENKTVTVIAKPVNDDPNYAYLADNYSMPTIPRGAILKRELSVNDTLLFWQKVYDGTNVYPYNPITLTVGNHLIQNDDITLTAAYNSKNVKDAHAVEFTLTGRDANNYTVEDLDFSTELAGGNYLIKPLVTEISWTKNSLTRYNGYTQTLEAYLSVVGEDAKGNDGQLKLAVNIKMSKDGNGNDITPLEQPFRNAGTYLATADIPEGTDENLLSNYGINNSDPREFTIAKATTAVNWSNLSALSFVYDGTVKTVFAEVTLLGEDRNTFENTEYITITFVKNGVATEFKNAGDYILTASFRSDEPYRLLNNNYDLSNTSQNKTIAKAEITNIKFTGAAASWKYDNGEIHYFFAASDRDAAGFREYVAVGPLAETPEDLYYQYDNIAINVIYFNGVGAYNNGVVNAGAHTIRAAVEETENYLAWSGEIYVNVEKGTIGNVLLDTYTAIYDAQRHFLYARNLGTESTPSEFSPIKLPDGHNAVVDYTIAVAERPTNIAYDANYKADTNYAVDAGTYMVNARVTDLNGNYEPLVLANFMQILQHESAITWEYANQAEPDFTYNAENQTDTIKARIMRAGSGSETGRLFLNITIELLDAINVDEQLKSLFVVAGNYQMSATFIQNDEYEQLMNNYKLLNDVVRVEMKKYTVKITWYNNPEHHDGQKNEYDIKNPCVYDATMHGITAEGIGINNVKMDIVTAGTFEADNAGNYVASVSKIADGTDTVSVNGVDYALLYDLNYRLENTTLNWKIAPRPITVKVSEGNHLSKYYDGLPDFGFGAPAVTIPETSENVVVINIEYRTTNTKSAEYESRFAYTLTNVMAKDKNTVFLPISHIGAHKSNVNAYQATITFGILEIDGKEVDPRYPCNYEVVSDLSGIIQENDNIITPRPINLEFEESSHVYNGQTFEKILTPADEIDGALTFEEKYHYVLFYLTNPTTGARITNLYEGNYISMKAHIDGNIDAGKFVLTCDGIRTSDYENAQNYDISVKDALYTIERRNIAVKYNELLQSLQQTFTDVTASIDFANSDFTDLAIPEGESGTSVLQALLTSDSFGISIDNSWKNSVYHAYTRIVGAVKLTDETTNALLSASINSANYSIPQPILQITFIKLKDADAYEFNVETLDDLKHLDGDNEGLTETRDTFRQGALPSYFQIADIDGLVNGGYTTIAPIRNFRAHYDGGDRFIKNLNVLPDASAENAGNQAGFFAEIAEGSVKNITFTDIHVYITGKISAAGGFAGTVDSGVVLDHIVFQGTVYMSVDFDSDDSVKLGSFAGSADHAQVSDISVAVKITVSHTNSDTFYFGGLIGYANGGNYRYINVFADSTVVYRRPPASAYYGCVFGTAIGDTLSIEDCRYLSSSVYVDDGSNAMLYRAAFGNEATLNAPQETTYSEFIDANDEFTNLIDQYLIRKYLLPLANNGTDDSPIVITNFRQIALISAYPYMSFSVAENIRIPYEVSSFRRGFYGNITYENGSVIRAKNPSETALFKAAKDSQNVIIVRKEENEG